MEHNSSELVRRVIICTREHVRVLQLEKRKQFLPAGSLFPRSDAKGYVLHLGTRFRQKFNFIISKKIAENLKKRVSEKTKILTKKVGLTKFGNELFW